MRPSVGRLGEQQVGKIVSRIGEKAGVIVNPKTGKFASAHDLRRSFGDRWSEALMPADLMVLMRHETIDTTMRYYVRRQAKSTAAKLWEAAGAGMGSKVGSSRKLKA